MQAQTDCGKLAVKDGFVVCPVCKCKTSQYIRPDTSAQHLQLWCRTCKTKFLVNIDFGQCFEFSRCR